MRYIDNPELSNLYTASTINFEVDHLFGLVSNKKTFKMSDASATIQKVPENTFYVIFDGFPS